MTRTPEGWPPDAEKPRTVVAPMFPLPNVFLFPGTLMPLHIFEPRYRQMIEDLLDVPGRIVMATVLEDHVDELPGSPPVFEFAGLGEIARHERCADGCFDIVVFGLCRVRLREVASDRLYRKVEVTELQEQPAAPEEDRELRSQLARAISARTPSLRELPPDMPLGHMADFLLLRLQLPQACMQDLFARMSIADRARHALAEHARRPNLPPTLG